MFHVPLIFALKQLRISEIYMLFQPVRLHIFLHFIDKCSYDLQEIMKVSYIYSTIFENLKILGLQMKSLLKLNFSSILPIFPKHNFSQCFIRDCK